MNDHHLVNKPEIDGNFDYIMELQQELLSDTYKLKEKCFERAFLDEKTFEAICFFVCCFRKVPITEEILETCLVILNISPEIFLDTIQEFFVIHNRSVPSSLLSVVKKISKILENQ